MVTSAFPKDSEVPVFQKYQVSCQVLSLQKNHVFTWFLLSFLLGVLLGFLLGYNDQALMVGQRKLPRLPAPPRQRGGCQRWVPGLRLMGSSPLHN